MAIRGAGHVWNVLFILFIIVRPSRFAANMALNGIATQSSDLSLTNWKAAAALDDCVLQTLESNCCTHTSATGNTEAWWHVDLKQPRTIQYIRIYYRDNFANRFAGYQLYVSNTTDRTQGILFYEDTSINQDDLELDVTLPSPYVARYVIVYNYRQNPKRQTWYSNTAILELCEVQVFGCHIGTYGSGNCDQMCSENCFGGNCDATNGHCFYCFPEKHGNFCEQACSVNCKDGICEKDSAHCTDCVLGKHGNMCEIDCPNNCKDKTCLKYNGNCIACDPGFYGSSCNQKCSGNCKDKTCVLGSGLCKGCKAGYNGNKCDQSCPANCEDQMCIQNSGECTGCDPGYYGSGCYQSCSDNCANQTCNQNTGKCTECIKGKYGGVCNLDCSDNCKDKSCMKDNGYCLECVNGKYGDACDLDCSDNCKDKSCWKENGYCPECTPGKYGPYCSSDCPGRCKDNSCQQIDGVCNVSSQPDSFNNTAAGIGVAFGVIIMALVIVVILLIRRSSRNKGEDRKLTHITNVSESVRQSDLQKNSDGTYHGTGSHTMTQPIQSNRIDGHYEQLNPLKREPANVYETTKTVHKEDGPLYSNI